jgi:WD40 repeat protein
MKMFCRLGYLFSDFVTRLSWRKFLKNLLLFGIIPYLPALAVAYFWPIKPVIPRAAFPFPGVCCLLQFSPDSKCLMAARRAQMWPAHPERWTDGEKAGPIRIWDVDQGIERFSVADNWDMIWKILFSPDGRFVAARGSGGLKLWDTLSGKEVADLKPDQAYDFGHFAFSPNGQLLLIDEYESGTYYTKEHRIKLWHIGTQQETERISGDFESMVFSPDGNRIGTSVRGGLIRLWQEGDDGSFTLIGKQGVRANPIVLSPALNTAACATFWDQPDHIQLWDLSTLQIRHRIFYDRMETHPGSLSFTPDGKTLVGFQSGHRRGSPSWTTVWDVSATPHRKGVFADAEVSPDGNWVAIRTELSARFISLAKADDLHINEAPPSSYNSGWRLPVTFSPDSKTATIEGLYHEKKGTWLDKWLPQWLNPFYTPPSPGSGRPYVSLREVATNRELYAFEECDHAVFSPDGKVLATLHTIPSTPAKPWPQDHTIKLWDLPIRNTQREILCLAISVWLSSLVLICLLRMAAWYRRTKQGTESCKIVP